MALSSLRLRRGLSTFSTLHRYLAATPAISAPSYSSSPIFLDTACIQSPAQSRALLFQSRMFRSSSISLMSSRSSYNKDDEIGPDTILFEGCDYNHWLFVMDFPKDPKPSPEEMVRTYEETCAKGLNISVEEAKTKIYACSTTTYTGFQAMVTEEESKKFEGLPGVIFVLPDSYIDPQNKEYGGDKYINGTIIPRPPPVQYGRQTGRYSDRNRFPDQPRYDRQGQMANQQGRPSYGNQQGNPSYGNQQGNPSYGNQQGNPSYGNQRPTQGGGRNYGNPQNNLPQQSYGPPGQGERRDPMPMSASQGRGPYQSGGGGPVPSYQGNYNQGGPGNFHPQEQRTFPQAEQRSYGPPGQGDYRGENINYGSTQGANYGQGGGYQGQGSPEAYGQGAPSGYGQNYPGPGQGEGQSVWQGEQRNVQGEQRNYPPTGQTGYDQGRH